MSAVKNTKEEVLDSKQSGRGARVTLDTIAQEGGYTLAQVTPNPVYTRSTDGVVDELRIVKVGTRTYQIVKRTTMRR